MAEELPQALKTLKNPPPGPGTRLALSWGMDTRHRWPVLIVLLLSLLSVSASAYAECGRDLRKCTPAELEQRRQAVKVKMGQAQDKIIRRVQESTRLENESAMLPYDHRDWLWIHVKAVQLAKTGQQLGLWLANSVPGNELQDLSNERERIQRIQASQRADLARMAGPAAPASRLRATAVGGR